MCGIFCSIFKGDAGNCPKNCIKQYRRNIQRRGPDSSGETLVTTDIGYNITFYASVLWTQGATITRQPVESKHSIFLFNGDIFGGLDDSIRASRGDTLMVMDILETTLNQSHSLGSLQGPFAFIFYDKLKEELYFGLDKFGRVSLLIGSCHDGMLVTSVARQVEDADFTTIPSVGIFCLNLKTNVLSLTPYDVTNDLSGRLKPMECILKRKIIIKQTNRVIAPSTSNEIGGTKYGQMKLFDSIRMLDPNDIFEYLLSIPDWYDRVQQLRALLTNSVKKRTTGHKNRCKDCTEQCDHCTVGILFSGGVDCAILTVLANQFVERSQPIDLINVSFCEECKSPDRMTGYGTLEEVKRLCPSREWRFLEVNVSRSELAEEREKEIIDLVYPLNTVLDDSLGCALWFGSRGRTAVCNSPCKILLVGTGADELFGGYTKHRAAFKRGSWRGLQESLDSDWHDLPHRNLGRDNRVICDHGRQMRTPYLDEGVVEFIRSIPCWEKLFPSDELPKGVGDKLLLRLLAFDLGLTSASRLPKKALQFGSKIANRNENAHEVCQRLIRRKDYEKISN